MGYDKTPYWKRHRSLDQLESQDGTFYITDGFTGVELDEDDWESGDWEAYEPEREDPTDEEIESICRESGFWNEEEKEDEEEKEWIELEYKWRHFKLRNKDIEDYKKTLDYFNKVIHSDPMDIEAWIFKARISYCLKNYIVAIGCYNYILKKKPELFHVWNEKGDLLYELGRYEEAQSCYDMLPHIITCQGDWLYWQNEDFEDVYKINITEDGQPPIFDGRSSLIYISIVREWHYYIHIYDWFKVYKECADGSNQTRVNYDKLFSINVVGDWIYYINIGDDSKIYKIRTDGSDRTKVCEHKASSINVVDNWIYYINKSEGSKIYKIRTNGRDPTRLSENKVSSIKVIDDEIYYINKYEGSNIYSFVDPYLK